MIQIKAKVFKALTKRVDEDDDYVTANLVFHDTPKNREIATGLGYISHEQLTFALAHMADANRYDRQKILIAAGWATLPGSDEANRGLARACVESLEVNLQ